MNSRLLIERALAGVITLAALYLLLNSTFVSAWNAVHIDLTINWVASHALLDGEPMYGRTTLAERAEALNTPTFLVYSQLFTSYIQPPTSAFFLSPLTLLSWRDATHVFVILNHVFLFSAIVINLATLRPQLPWRYLLPATALIVAGFNQLHVSFILGQWDATLLLLLSIGFWASQRGKEPLAGIAIAIAASIKLIPALLLLYFLWRGRYSIVIWGVTTGAILLAAALPLAGPENCKTYFKETVPAVLKGSTNYTNNTLQAVLARFSTPELHNGIPEALSLDEVARSPLSRLASLLITLAAAAAVLLALGKRNAATNLNTEARAFEYYLVMAAGLLVSSITWEFYVIWLLPIFLVAFLSPAKALPRSLPLRLLCLTLLTLAYLGLNYPGDYTLTHPDSNLFSPDHILFRPGWVPGIWLEDKLRLYHNHIDAVLLVRLPSLILLVATVWALVAWRSRSPGAPASEP